jgi:MFS family permease
MAFIGIQMQTLAVEWEAYNRTGRYLSLAYIGLLNFAPVFLLALPAGFLADHLERRRIVIVGNLTMLLASLSWPRSLLEGAELAALPSSFCWVAPAAPCKQPARAALMPQIVPRHIFSNAVTWSGGGFQLASVLGPALGGFVIGFAQTTAPAFLLAALGTGTFASLARCSGRDRPPPARTPHGVLLAELVA